MKRKIVDRDKVLRPVWWLFAAIVFVLVIAIRIRLLGIPLERDEGEYAYVGQLMLEGIPPYKLAYNMKFPGTYAAYAGIMSIFGQTTGGIHFGLLLVNAATAVLVYFLGRQLANSRAGIAAAIAYMILSVSSSVLGLAAHATHFVMLPVVGATLLLLKQSDRKAVVTLFASGLLFGVGVLMKQPAVFFVLFGAIYLIASDIRRQLELKEVLLRSFIFASGVVLPFGITCLLLWSAGVFGRFWFWTIDYARQYGSLSSLMQARQRLALDVADVIKTGCWALWLLAGFGLVAGLRHKATRTSTGFVLGLLACGAMAVSSGLYFRNHYFILVLPAVSLLVGVAISRLTDCVIGRAEIVRFVPFFLLAGAVSLPFFLSKTIFFEASPVDVCRMIYGANPFSESVRIAEYVRNHTEPNDTVAVLGSEPQIYFYSRRHSATGYIYTYSLMEPQSYALSMQQEMIREIELASPKYLISIQMPFSWMRRRESEPLFFNWAKEYLQTHYEVVGLVVVAPDGSDYYFGELPKSVEPSSDYVLVYARKT